MKIVEVDRPGALLDAAFHDILVPSFPPDQLCTLATISATLEQGITSVSAVVDEAGRPIAAAVGDWSEASQVQLLSYLAVLPAHRAKGIGGRLLVHGCQQWRERYRPCAILAEIEHPAAHRASEAYGDPEARVRFYARHGAKALDLPYFQPALRPETARCYGMILICLHADPQLLGPDGTTISSRAVHSFLATYFESTEGGAPEDPAGVSLFTAIDQTAGIPLLADRIPHQ